MRTNEGFTLSNKEKFAWTKYLGTLLKLCTNEKPINENCMNEGSGVFIKEWRNWIIFIKKTGVIWGWNFHVLSMDDDERSLDVWNH